MWYQTLFLSTWWISDVDILGDQDSWYQMWYLTLSLSNWWISYVDILEINTLEIICVLEISRHCLSANRDLRIYFILFRDHIWYQEYWPPRISMIFTTYSKHFRYHIWYQEYWPPRMLRCKTFTIYSIYLIS